MKGMGDNDSGLRKEARDEMQSTATHRHLALEEAEKRGELHLAYLIFYVVKYDYFSPTQTAQLMKVIVTLRDTSPRSRSVNMLL